MLNLSSFIESNTQGETPFPNGLPFTITLGYIVRVVGKKIDVGVTQGNYRWNCVSPKASRRRPFSLVISYLMSYVRVVLFRVARIVVACGRFPN